MGDCFVFADDAEKRDDASKVQLARKRLRGDNGIFIVISKRVAAIRDAEFILCTGRSIASSRIIPATNCNPNGFAMQ